MDPRFAGFTQAARVSFQLAVDFTDAGELCVTTKGLSSRGAPKALSVLKR